MCFGVRTPAGVGHQVAQGIQIQQQVVANGITTEPPPQVENLADNGSNGYVETESDVVETIYGAGQMEENDQMERLPSFGASVFFSSYLGVN